ncbi:DNA helicase PcrA [Thermosediminibacter oceani]|uniref:ATP-dependent DNA helicase n=1 Tax=Thermosediminibacter oceani (strain ATCC BAA-1034 / DSM 16646 / JW/IW-1228P) TaxID=555079 RepID=D9RYR8_THEOJ|nr:DNA helicase PcrA [Thermosediminibacter oceani]ADL08492.1 ATP-dependent DNA helicase PcrA [Thermosediminibacter oceani DSM 16646]
MNYLSDLNEEQRKAVTHPGGPLLILAGAGSGKTRVLTYRIAYLIEKMGVDPGSIMAITFTNKAAQEMKERIEKLLPWARGMLVSTFHSACVRILRSDIDKLGYNKNFIIFDTQDQLVLIRDCIKALGLDEKKYAPTAVLNYIGRAKDRLQTPEECHDRAKDIREKAMSRVYELYQKRLKESNALDFDDLIMKTVELFRKNPEVLSYYQNRFRHILVDEYQDTNRAQYVLVKLLAEKHRNLCVVGDDDQSIYGFRGADIRNILDFEEDFPDATVIRLEQNYRSTQNILDAANSVISHNFDRKQKSLWTENGRGDKIYLATLGNEHEEAFFIAREIEKLVNMKNFRFRDFAVLYRTNAQSRVLEEMMVKMGLPYKIVGGVRFYQRREIKDILAYLRVVANPSDNVSLLRIINVPRRGIGEATVETLKLLAEEREKSVYHIMKEELAELSSRVRSKLRDFVDMIDDFIKKAGELSVPDLIAYILDRSGYLKELEAENTPDAQSRIENLKEMIGVAIEFEKKFPGAALQDFLAEIALVSDVDEFDEDRDAVILMTLHSAKGLEFPVVFLSGMDEGIFPHSRAMFDEEELEEERRLCYVGITRAKKRLYLTRAWSRNLYGNTSYYSASRFIDEIPARLIKEIRPGDDTLEEEEKPREDKKAEQAVPVKPRTQKLKTGVKPQEPVKLNPGDRVKHSKWGEGVVTAVYGAGENTEIAVNFASEGTKRLMLKYAPLVKI